MTNSEQQMAHPPSAAPSPRNSETDFVRSFNDAPSSDVPPMIMKPTQSNNTAVPSNLMPESQVTFLL